MSKQSLFENSETAPTLANWLLNAGFRAPDRDRTERAVMFSLTAGGWTTRERGRAARSPLISFSVTLSHTKPPSSTHTFTHP